MLQDEKLRQENNSFVTIFKKKFLVSEIIPVQNQCLKM